MADLEVNGKITLNGKNVATLGDLRGSMFTSNGIVLYSSTSLSTGQKTISSSYRFSGFNTLAFGQFTTVTEGYAWQFMPLEIFKLYTSAGLYVQQNISSQDRRLKILYVDDTHFKIDYLDGANGFTIVGYI